MKTIGTNRLLLDTLKTVAADYEDEGCDGCGTITEATIEAVRAAVKEGERQPDANYIVLHHHRFGCSVYLVYCDHVPDEDEVNAALPVMVIP